MKTPRTTPTTSLFAVALREYAEVLSNDATVIEALSGAAEEIDRLRRVVSEIAVDVVLADGLSTEGQVAALWGVVGRHTEISKAALS